MRRAPLALLALGAASCGVASASWDAGLGTHRAPPDAAALDVAAEAVDLFAARAALDASCEGCHAGVAAEWRGSAHARAATHPVYVAEHAVTNATWCNDCHAPLADSASPDVGAGRGVGCLSCHAPHDGRPHPEAPAVRACAGCHDAPFPSAAESAHAHFAAGERLQRTAEEWRSSPDYARGGSCIHCHARETGAPGETSHTSHAMPGGRDDAIWQGALEVHADARRGARGVRVRVTLAVRGAGHAVPTGDMYRRLLVRAECAGAASPCAAERDLRRRFGPGPRGMRQTADDRVPADGAPRVVTLALPAGVTTAHWSVTWLALDPALAERRGLPSALVRHEVASGDVAVP